MPVAGPGLGNNNDVWNPITKRVDITSTPVQGPGLGNNGDVWNPTTRTVNNTSGQVLGASTGPTSSGSSNSSSGSYADWLRRNGYNDQNVINSLAANPPDWLRNALNIPSQDDIKRQIDEAYSGSENYLNQAEGALKADYPNALAEAESIFNTNKSTLEGQKATAGEKLTQQQNKATQTKENALADARRLYQEQQIGATQRFGGSSSAGQAFSEIQAREQARQFGQTGRQYADVVNQIETQRNQVDREFQTGLLQLDQQKQSAVSNAQRDFQNKLLQFSNSRAMIGQAKAEAKLGALQELRNQIFAIEQQNTQFTQQLQLMREQAMLQTQNFGGAVSGAVSAGSNAANAYNPLITSNYSATAGMGQQPAPAQPQLTGSISPRRDEQQGNGGFFGNVWNYLNTPRQVTASQGVF